MLKPLSFFRALTRIQILVLLVCLFSNVSLAALGRSGVHAGLGLETSSFLKTQTTRGTNVSTAVAGVSAYGNGDSSWVAWGVDPHVYVFLHDYDSIAPEAQNFYIATGQNISSHHQFTFGRRYFHSPLLLDEWDYSQNLSLLNQNTSNITATSVTPALGSAMEDRWQLGMWSPRFLWDPLRIKQVGLTGLHYNYNSKYFQALAFGTLVSIPERGATMYESGGKLKSSSPFFTPFYERVKIIQGEANIRYTLEEPPLDELLVNPAGMARLRVGKMNSGPWISGAYGYMPMSQVSTPFHYALYMNTQSVDVHVHPQILYHHLVGGEGGWSEDFFRVWASVHREVPEVKKLPSDWISANIGEADIYSGGAEFNLNAHLAAQGSYLYVDEAQPKNFQTSSLSAPLASRFSYKNAWQFGLKLHGFSSRLFSNVSYVNDVDNKSTLIRFDMNYRFKELLGGDWLIGVGGDFIESETSQGWFGKYKGNSRMIGRLAYAF